MFLAFLRSRFVEYLRSASQKPDRITVASKRVWPPLDLFLPALLRDFRQVAAPDSGAREWTPQIPPPPTCGGKSRGLVAAVGPDTAGTLISGGQVWRRRPGCILPPYPNPV